MVGGWLVGFEASLEGTTPFSNLGISIKIQKGWATTPQHEIIQCVFEGHRNYSSQVSSWWSPPLFLGPLGWNHPPVAVVGPLYVTAKTGSRMSFIPVAAFERPGIWVWHFVYFTTLGWGRQPLLPQDRHGASINGRNKKVITGVISRP